MRRPIAIAPALLALLAVACDGEVDAASARRAQRDPKYAVSEEWRSLDAATPRMDSRAESARTEGVVTQWHLNGTKAGEGAFHAGVRTGPWSFWYDNGVLRWQGSFADGVASGPERAWYPNGQARFEGTLDRGLRKGLYRCWYENGTPELEAEYLDDLLHGRCRRWTFDGRLDRAESGLYERGRKVAEL